MKRLVLFFVLALITVVVTVSCGDAAITFANETTAPDVTTSEIANTSEAGSLAFYPTFDQSGYAVIGLGSYTGSDVEIPATYEGLPVVEIGNYAFLDCANITSVTIPDGVTKIGEKAFALCPKLKSVTIPDSVTTIGAEAFSTCESLESIVLPENLLEISEATFKDCEGLESVILNDALTVIGKQAFYGCAMLGEISLGANVSSISIDAFRECAALYSIKVSEENTTFTAVENCLILKDSKTLYLGCNGSIIPANGSVTAIGDDAFWACYGLNEVEIPSAVTSIGNGAFFNCINLNTLSIGVNVTEIGMCAFDGCAALVDIIIPESVTYVGFAAFGGCGAAFINCEAKSQPAEWDEDWNIENVAVIWGFVVE